MARYDFYKLGAEIYLLDCQSETLTGKSRVARGPVAIIAALDMLIWGY
jgi:hypothetical protein